MLSALDRPVATSVLLLGAIAIGSAIGGVAPEAGARVGALADPLVLALVTAVFATVRLEGLRELRRCSRLALIAAGVNFLVVPVVAFALTRLLPDEAIRLGVLIYCLAPCTDWFLGFTRLAKGDTTTGAALVPLQMLIQLALYPAWLAVFSGLPGSGVLESAVPALLTWFVLPAAIGLGIGLVARRVLPDRISASVEAGVDRAVPVIIALLVVALFAGNVGTILAEPSAFALVLGVVFLFFVAMWGIGEIVARAFRLRRDEHVLLTMTTSARNAPLMIGLTSIALPDQPLVVAAIVLGMLIEFPHLTVLTHLLRRGRREAPSVGPARVAA